MKNFLIADSSQIVLEVLEFTLEQNNFNVLQACTAEKTIELYKKHQVDFVLLNIQLGDEDGIDLAQKLLNIKKTNILIMSNTQNHDLKQRAKQIGVVGWILKPFIPNHLIKMLIKTFSINY